MATSLSIAGFDDNRPAVFMAFKSPAAGGFPCRVRLAETIDRIVAVAITRIQLSLYVPGTVGAELDALRRLLDPIQAGLIPAHVTLCREDECVDLEPATLRSRSGAAEAAPVTLVFGPPESFHGHGILMPCVSGAAAFQGLRRWLLGSNHVRRPAPHITLAHPRNPKSPGNNGAHASRFPGGLGIVFTTACRIQQEGSAPWQVLEQYALAGAARGAG